MSWLKEDTHQQQSLLAEYCRDGYVPENLKGIKKENLHNYRRLVFNIALDTLETAYPITHSFLPSDIWETLTYSFFSQHKCQTPQVWKMPLEFYEYCKEKNIAGELKMPFLNDVLYVEWLELEVHTMDDVDYPKFTTKGDWMENAIAINPEYKLVQLSYPCHTTAPTDLAGKEGNYFLLIYREKESGNVQFIDLSILYAYILEQIINGVLLKDILVEANNLFQLNNIALLKEHALNFIKDLEQRKFVLGFLKK
jgi:uncharacterized protein